jgi:hypothetical protein
MRERSHVSPDREEGKKKSRCRHFLSSYVNVNLLTAAKKPVHHNVDVELIQDPLLRNILQEHVDPPAPMLGTYRK